MSMDIAHVYVVLALRCYRMAKLEWNNGRGKALLFVHQTGAKVVVRHLALVFDFYGGWVGMCPGGQVGELENNHVHEHWEKVCKGVRLV